MEVCEGQSTGDADWSPYEDTRYFECAIGATEKDANLASDGSAEYGVGTTISVDVTQDEVSFLATGFGAKADGAEGRRPGVAEGPVVAPEPDLDGIDGLSLPARGWAQRHGGDNHVEDAVAVHVPQRERSRRESAEVAR